jgi:hypothetical protein
MPTGRGRTDPRFYLTAAPLHRVEIPTLFEPDGVATILEEPPTLRQPTVGWDLWTLDECHAVEGRKASLVNGYRKRLSLYTGGSLTFVASFIEFLGWPRSPAEFLEDPALNGVALLELIYNFALTFAAVCEHMEPTPTRVRLWSGFRDLDLPSGRRVHLEGGHVAPEESYDFPTRDRRLAGDFAEEAAYELVVPTHEWFGCSPESIPFVDHERKRLDSAALHAHLVGSNALADPRASAEREISRLL